MKSIIQESISYATYKQLEEGKLWNVDFPLTLRRKMNLPDKAFKLSDDMILLVGGANTIEMKVLHEKKAVTKGIRMTQLIRLENGKKIIRYYLK